MSLHRAKELRAERFKVYQEGREIMDRAISENRDLTTEEKQEFDARMDRVDALEKQVKEIEDRSEKLKLIQEQYDARQEYLDGSKEFGAKRESAEEEAVAYRSAFRKWMTGGMTSLAKEDRDRLNKVRTEMRALGQQVKGTDSQGGFLVPEDYRAELYMAMKDFGGMRDAARVITTATGRLLPWPTSDDTGNVAKIIGEATAISTSTPVPFGQTTMEAALYHSGPIKVSVELDQDSELNVEQIVRDMMAIRFGRVWNQHFTTRSSTEATGPHGIVNDSTGAVATTGGSAGLSFDTLHDLEAAVDPAYRRRGAVWMFNDNTRSLLRKLREFGGSSGQYLWQPSLQAGTPDTLLGYPVVINQDLESFGVAGGSKPIFFGDFSYYVIRDVRAMFMQRLVERYAEEGVYALLAYARVDGRNIAPSTAPARRPYRCVLAST